MAAEPTTTGSTTGSSSNLRPIDLGLEQFVGKSFVDFRTQLYERLTTEKDRHFRFYDGQRRDKWGTLKTIRTLLTWLGALAIILTAAGTTLRIAYPEGRWDLAALVFALILYAVMAAVVFIDKNMNLTSSYFRHLNVVLSIRELWTKLEFQLLKEFSGPEPAKADEEAAKERLRALGEAFCNDVNKLSSVEITDWGTEFRASLSELDQVARKGSESVSKQVEDLTKKLADATTAAMAKAEEANKPAYLNVEFVGTFDAPVTVLVDDKQVAVTPLKIYPVELRTGFRKIEARAKNGDKDVQAAVVEEVKAGVKPLKLTLAG